MTSHQTGVAINSSWLIFILVQLLSIFHIQLSNQQQQQQAFVAPNKQPIQLDHDLNQVKILIPNLPHHHYQYWLKNHPRAFKIYNDLICPQYSEILKSKDIQTFLSYQTNLTFEDVNYSNDINYGIFVLGSICSNIKVIPKSCWGYETNCQEIHLMPDCSGAKNEQEQKIVWFSQADFGYVLERRKELSKFCSPNKNINDSWVSSFECTRYFQTCRGNNLYIHFNITDDVMKQSPLPNDIIGRGNIGGWNCDLQRIRIREEDGQRKRLQSWFNEFEHYDLVHANVQPQQICDLIIEKQTFLIKLDTTDNLYNTLSNFINLYATIHMNNRFSDDIQIVVWDNQLPSDRTGKFELLYLAFSKFMPMVLSQFNGKRVCFRKFIAVLPPKLDDGLMNFKKELAPGCSKSGLFDAFSKHILHRARIPQIYSAQQHFQTKNNLIRVTFLTRSNNRIIENESKLKKAIEGLSKKYYVQSINVEESKLNMVLTYVTNTDILIGLHGSELATCLFLPDWAVLMELHDFGDSKYRDLARLKGVTYMRIDNRSELIKKTMTGSEDGAVDKEANYRVNEAAFLKVFAKTVDKLKMNRERHFKPFEYVETIAPPAETTTTTSTTTTTPKPYEQDQEPQLQQPVDSTQAPPTPPQLPPTTTSTTTTPSSHNEL